MSACKLTVQRISPLLPAFAKLTAALDAYQQSLYPDASNHLDSIDRLIEEDAVVFGAFHDDLCVGCGALKCGEGVGELKRMYVLPEARGQGAARLLLGALEQAARDAGVSIVRLETGIHQHEAIGLYRKAGYESRGPYGNYPEDPLSVYMEKNLCDL